jgi:hypothetical protein
MTSQYNFRVTSFPLRPTLTRSNAIAAHNQRGHAALELTELVRQRVLRHLVAQRHQAVLLLRQDAIPNHYLVFYLTPWPQRCVRERREQQGHPQLAKLTLRCVVNSAHTYTNTNCTFQLNKSRRSAKRADARDWTGDACKPRAHTWNVAVTPHTCVQVESDEGTIRVHSLRWTSWHECLQLCQFHARNGHLGLHPNRAATYSTATVRVEPQSCAQAAPNAPHLSAHKPVRMAKHVSACTTTAWSRFQNVCMSEDLW